MAQMLLAQTFPMANNSRVAWQLDTADRGRRVAGRCLHLLPAAAWHTPPLPLLQHLGRACTRPPRLQHRHAASCSACSAPLPSLITGKGPAAAGGCTASCMGLESPAGGVRGSAVASRMLLAACRICTAVVRLSGSMPVTFAGAGMLAGCCALSTGLRQASCDGQCIIPSMGWPSGGWTITCSMLQVHQPAGSD